MCNWACIGFVEKNLTREEIAGKEVLEVGSLDVNGSVRPFAEAFHPASYLGIDIQSGPGVDRVVDAHYLVEEFGKNAFDVIVSTEVAEHIHHWKLAFAGMKKVLRPGGLILLTTVAKGFYYHGYPYDFWRYELDDLKRIFGDFDIEALEKNDERNAVFVKARKPLDWKERDLSGDELYSIITRSRIKELANGDLRRFKWRYLIRRRFWKIVPRFMRRGIDTSWT